MDVSPEEAEKRIAATTLFTRMFPEAKLKIINTLKAQQQIVGMTGDGVNDPCPQSRAHRNCDGKTGFGNC